MVIFDTSQNYDGKIKGMLYMSLIDADYLLKKYGSEELKRLIPEDYVIHFEGELESRKEEDTYSEQYFSALSLGIENEDDERLLVLLSQEVEMGNIFTRTQLAEIPRRELVKRLYELTKQEEPEENLEQIYTLRSYKMARFVLQNIDDFNDSVEEAYEYVGTIFQFAHEKDMLDDIHNLRAMAALSDISESTYFDEAVALSKKFTEKKNLE
ncbi:MAG: hypothetical protein OSJ70_07275 [Bacilli bacterium]|nr:hypothetical protein [Bacilli bacterium]